MLTLKRLKRAWRESSNKERMAPARIATGLALILLGIPGLFLPWLQGIALIAAGILTLSNKSLKKFLKELRSH